MQTRPTGHSDPRSIATIRRVRPAPGADARDSRLDTGVEPERLVKTHCCFCGQQCGMQLKVKDNEVIGVEPWYEFPFNQGHALPQGRQALSAAGAPRPPAARLPKRPGGARRLRADALRRGDPPRGRRDRAHPAQHGNDAFAVLSGASLTTEKTYLMGKFAHMCLRTANIDYNGRLCMVSAAAGNKKAFGIDRAANPCRRHPRRRGRLDQRRQRRRVRADHHELRLAGARAGRQGHRRRPAHHPDRPDLRPVPAGQAGARHGALQRHPAPDDRERLARS
jgi:hypothetical protein